MGIGIVVSEGSTGVGDIVFANLYEESNRKFEEKNK